MYMDQPERDLSLEKVNAALQRLGDALTVNIIIQLLSSFEGTMVYPKSEDKEDLFVKATENTSCHLIPDETYLFDRLKKSDNARVTAKANVNKGCWCILK